MNCNFVIDVDNRVLLWYGEGIIEWRLWPPGLEPKTKWRCYNVEHGDRLLDERDEEKRMAS
jgi:hypothetical protein